VDTEKKVYSACTIPKNLTASVHQSTALNPSRFNGCVVQGMYNANGFIALSLACIAEYRILLALWDWPRQTTKSIVCVSKYVAQDWLQDVRLCNFLSVRKSWTA